MRRRHITKTPNPGSDEAVAQGCICPILDNGRGNQRLGETRGFVINEGCPLHDERVKAEEGDRE